MKNTETKKKLKFNHKAKRIVEIFEGMSPEEFISELENIHQSMLEGDKEYLDGVSPEMIVASGYTMGHTLAPEDSTLEDAFNRLTEMLEVDKKFIALTLAFMGTLANMGNNVVSKNLECLSQAPVIDNEIRFKCAFIYGYMKKHKKKEHEDN